MLNYMMGLGLSLFKKKKKGTQAAVWGKDERRTLVCSGDLNPSLCYERKPFLCLTPQQGKTCQFQS